MKSSSRQFISGIIICVLGAVCFSTKAIVVKIAYRETNVDAITLLSLRMLFSLPFFVGSALLSSSRKGNVRFTASDWMGVAVVGCLGYYVSSLLDFIGLQYISAGIERLVLFIYPTLVLFMSAVIFRERITRIQWIAVGITYAGLLFAFISEASTTQTEHFVRGSLLIFACAITYAAYIVGSGRLIPSIGPAKFNSYAMSFAAAAVLIHDGFSGTQSLWNLSTDVYAYSVVMAILSTVIPSFLVAEGIKRIGADNTAIVSSIGPVSTIIQASILLGEPVSALQIMGTAFVLAGILLIGWNQRKTAEEKSS